MLSELVRAHRVIVCCGAGGVGKTTTAASLAIAAARLGRRVLVLTIDPSRRLAEALGVSRNPPEPVALPADRQAAARIKAPGSIDAWMLDPKLVTDSAVRRFARTEEAVQAILQNRLYQQGTQMVAGMHEYTAMKALHQFIVEGRYDLVVLDTPPSRNALDFLDAPGRLSRFLDGPIFRMFLPAEGGLLAQTGARVVWRVLETALGATFATELKSFFHVFSQLLGSLSNDLNDVRLRLSADDVAFVLVTTASPAALTEARFFHDKIRQLGLPFGGFVVNRSMAVRNDRIFPTPSLLAPEASEALKTGLDKLKWLARAEALAAARDRGLLAELALRGGQSAFSIALPNVTAGAGDIATLDQLADLILDERRSGPR
jgi:anion-transporting  ArsA/GET3 family ATPase